MKCPNCNSNFDNKRFCPVCGIDVALYIKTNSASNKLYNKGLQQANAGDISGAVYSLSQSITFNKFNIDARNLLGLVMYEKGMIGDALRHWIISSSICKENNQANKYIEKLQKNGRTLEKYNDAVRMYNQALRYLLQGSDDLAIIQLKKAIDFNPRLVEAYNLLCLCYIKQGEKSKADSLIEKVFNMDVNNLLAFHYFQILYPSKDLTLGKFKDNENNKFQKKAASHRMADRRRASRTGIGRNEVIAFFVGLICCASVLMILIFPGIDEGKAVKIKQLEATIKTLESGDLSTLSKNNDDYKALQDENEKLKSEIEGYRSEALRNEITAKIQEAIQFNKEKNYEDAAVLISEIDTSSLTDDLKASYNAVKFEAYPKAADSFYDLGRREFLNNNFDTALVYLENCLKFSNGEDFVDDAVFYIGKIAENSGDLDKAKTYYERIINEYPSSNQYKNAELNLKNLQQQ